MHHMIQTGQFVDSTDREYTVVKTVIGWCVQPVAARLYAVDISLT